MSAPAIDRATFDALQESTGAEFANELVDTFLEEAPVMFGELDASLAAGDATTFKRAAHSLKSNSLTFGALALGAMARELELAGVANVIAGGGAPLAALADEYARVAAVLLELQRG
ncbi:MAG: Hpt domain-containing protein [Casimicrobiaceae bacterium]